MAERLTEAQCRALFERLFPNGLDDRALVEELAPEGWDRSPLLLVYHPTAEQVYEETLKIRENLRNLLKRDPASLTVSQPLTLDAVRRDLIYHEPNPIEECADLLGCCLWDVCADNHEVVTAEGTLVDLGSFRAAAGFIADFRHRRNYTQESFGSRGDYIEFYMGTTMIRHRADLTPMYELIFRRMHQIGLGWRYTHPRLYAIDLSSLPNLAEDDVPEALRYDPTESFWRERQLAERQTELAEFRQSLDEAYRASIQNACDGRPPATVRAYQRVHGRDPDGWPPKVEDQE
ncbi:MAG: hypothetical protein AB7F94_12375 [Nitrospira sp.]